MSRRDPIVNAVGFAATIKRWRRRLREVANRLLARFGTHTPRAAPLATDTRRILVVRLNKRLGNVLFLTPMLRTLADSLPQATIDVLIARPEQAPLLEHLPGIGEVLVRARGLRGLLGQTYRLRQRRYDLVIEPTGNSWSNRLTVSVSGARQRLAFAASDQWLTLTHAASRPQSRHQGIKAVELLVNGISGVHWQRHHHLSTVIDPSARRDAAALWQTVLGDDDGRPVIGFFTRATARKQLADAWWQAWHREIALRCPGAWLVEILPPGAAAPLAADIATLQERRLDRLAALIERMDVFIAADSGPMHLAAAAGTPVVGLFQATNPAAYAPLGPRCTSLAAAELTPAAAAQAAARLIDEADAWRSEADTGNPRLAGAESHG